MVVFLAASDESKPGNAASGKLIYSGLIASRVVWDQFIPSWSEQVLQPEPSLDYFHTVDLRNPKLLGRTRAECEARIEAAWTVIRETPSPKIVSSEILLEEFNSVFGGKTIHVPGRADQAFRAEHLAFITYLLDVLDVVGRIHPEVSRVDFVFEGGGSELNTAFSAFFNSFKRFMLPTMGLHLLAALVGSLSFAGKEYVPVQAADLVAWHARRIASGGKLTERERHLFDSSTEKLGIRHIWRAEDIQTFHSKLESSIASLEAGKGLPPYMPPQK